MATPSSRAQKLRGIMAPSDDHPYGQSSNALAKEADVHLNVFIQFLETGGSPEKFDAATGEYTTSHLRLLAEWIDNHEEPPPPRLLIIREGSESSQSSRTITPRADGRRRRGAPTPLDDFLCSIDEKLLVYAEKLVNLGVKRPGDLAHFSLDDLARGGIKKLHARRLKSDPLVFHDAQQLMEQVSEEGDDDQNDDEDGGRQSVSAAEDTSRQLQELLQHAESLGLSGPDLEQAKAALAKGSGTGQEAGDPKPLFDFLESLGDPTLASYGQCLADAGVTRPGDLNKLSLADLVEAGVKKLHARRLKSEPAVFHDSIAMEEAMQQP